MLPHSGLSVAAGTETADRASCHCPIRRSRPISGCPTAQATWGDVCSLARRISFFWRWRCLYEPAVFCFWFRPLRPVVYLVCRCTSDATGCFPTQTLFLGNTPKMWDLRLSENIIWGSKRAKDRHLLWAAPQETQYIEGYTAVGGHGTKAQKIPKERGISPKIGLRRDRSGRIGANHPIRQASIRGCRPR